MLLLCGRGVWSSPFQQCALEFGRSCGLNFPDEAAQSIDDQFIQTLRSLTTPVVVLSFFAPLLFFTSAVAPSPNQKRSPLFATPSSVVPCVVQRSGARRGSCFCESSGNAYRQSVISSYRGSHHPPAHPATSIGQRHFTLANELFQVPLPRYPSWARETALS